MLFVGMGALHAASESHGARTTASSPEWRTITRGVALADESLVPVPIKRVALIFICVSEASPARREALRLSGPTGPSVPRRAGLPHEAKRRSRDRPRDITA